MENQTRPKCTRREKLGNGPAHRPRLPLDMEKVYRDLDNNMTVKAVADKYNVSEATLRRRHKEYQAAIESEETKENDTYKLPPLPPDL